MSLSLHMCTKQARNIRTKNYFPTQKKNTDMTKRKSTFDFPTYRWGSQSTLLVIGSQCKSTNRRVLLWHYPSAGVSSMSPFPCSEKKEIMIVYNLQIYYSFPCPFAFSFVGRQGPGINVARTVVQGSGLMTRKKNDGNHMHVWQVPGAQKKWDRQPRPGKKAQFNVIENIDTTNYGGTERRKERKKKWFPFAELCIELASFWVKNCMTTLELRRRRCEINGLSWRIKVMNFDESRSKWWWWKNLPLRIGSRTAEIRQGWLFPCCNFFFMHSNSFFAAWQWHGISVYKWSASAVDRNQDRTAVVIPMHGVRIR